MSVKTRLRLSAVILFVLGLSLSESFPPGTMMIGSLSWEYFGGMVVGLSIGVMWSATGRDAAERMGRA